MDEKREKNWNDKLYEWFTHYCDEDIPYNALHTIVLGAIHQAKDDVVEPVAKAIYDQMECFDPRGKPEWVENGNSLKQDEARKLAKQALTQPNNK